MASPDAPNTGPKPFVLVLMPFAKEFNDVYTFGIKGAAEDVGAYAERIDEQTFQEGILDRIFNQISKADVIVADMTGQNPNVFYEVGYAHALNKIVILITRDANAIPFDLKHRQHIVYPGEIGTLRPMLKDQLTWAIGEARRRQQTKRIFRVTASRIGIEIPEMSVGQGLPPLVAPLRGPNGAYVLSFEIENESQEASDVSTNVYFFTDANEDVKISGQQLPVSKSDQSKLGLTRKHQIAFLPSMPPGVTETVSVEFVASKPFTPIFKSCLRLFSRRGPVDFPFNVLLVIDLLVNPATLGFGFLPGTFSHLGRKG
jgi:hypothetical protein